MKIPSVGRAGVSRATRTALHLTEHLPDPGHLERTRRDDRESDATIWFGELNSVGSRAIHEACSATGRPCFDVIEGSTRPSDVAAWIEAEGIRVLNVAGHRESVSPVIGDRAERFLVAVFRKLAEG